MFKSEDGQAIVEFVLVVPILLILVFGAVDAGRAVNYWNDANHLANVGARYAAVGSTGGMCNGTDYSTGHTLQSYLLCQAAQDSAELANGSGGGTGPQGALKVCISIPTASVGQQVTVKVSTQFNWVPWPAFVGGSSAALSSGVAGNATMRIENVPPVGDGNILTTSGTCP